MSGKSRNCSRQPNVQGTAPEEGSSPNNPRSFSRWFFQALKVFLEFGIMSGGPDVILARRQEPSFAGKGAYGGRTAGKLLHGGPRLRFFIVTAAGGF